MQSNPAGDLERAARALLGQDEALTFDDVDAALETAVATFRKLSARDDVRQLLAAGERLYEVPFSLDRDGTRLRGAIDCLVIGDGEVTVIEFKTGRKRAEHQTQLDVYVDAARELFPGARVSGALIYP
jgi:ATP-dependent exoDNAse (exonuclease V) beta subunit